MATVDIQNNPIAPIVGARDADAVLITSQQDTVNLVSYQIEKISTADSINIDSSMNSSAGGNIVSVSRTTLKIILESRMDYRVRTREQFGAWSAWVNFTTRDKRYQSPDAITSLTDDTDSSAQTQGTKVVSGNNVAQGGSRVIAVANNAKATERDNAGRGNERAARNWGPVTVTNTDTIYNDGQLQRTGTATLRNGDRVSIQSPIAFTNRGATVVNVPAGQGMRIVYTNRGATINTIG